MNDDARKSAARSNAISAAIGATLMIYFGFGTAPVGASDSRLYNASVDVFRWTLQIGGIALAVIALACLLGVVVALAVDAFVSGAVGVIFLCCGAIWTINGDLQGLLFLIFGMMFLSAGRRCWADFRQPAAARPATGMPVEPVHPATIRPDVLPKPGEPPPPEGYLAALAREKREAPRADLE